jgi:hypothetical protein
VFDHSPAAPSGCGLFLFASPVAFIISVNINRRHLTKGQRAMATAKIQPEPLRGRGVVDPVGKAAETAGISYRRIAEARMVLRYAPDLADSVLSGAVMLDKAYETATKRKREAAQCRYFYPERISRFCFSKKCPPRPRRCSPRAVGR